MNEQKRTKIIDELDLYFDDCEAIMAATRSDDEQQWLTNFYKKLIKETSYIEEYCVIVESEIKYLDDKAWAEKLYKKAIKDTDDVDDYCVLATSILKTFANKDWANKLYQQAIDEAESVYEYCGIAFSIVDDLGDKSKASDLYTTAIKLIVDSDDCCIIAKGVVRQLDDKEWAAKIYQQAIDEAKNCDECIAVAVAIAEVLDCNPWAKAIIDALLEDRNNIAMNYRELVGAIIDIFDDYDWARKILKETYKMLSVSLTAAQSMTITIDDDELECAPNGTKLFLEFAETVASILKDKQWAAKIVLETVEDAQTVADYCAAGEIVKNYLDATAMAVKFYQAAYDKISNIDELIELTEAVIGDLDDQYWGRELCHEAVAKCETVAQYCSIAKVVAGCYGLDDKQWSEEIFKTAQDCAKTEDDIEAVKEAMESIEDDNIPF